MLTQANRAGISPCGRDKETLLHSDNPRYQNLEQNKQKIISINDKLSVILRKYSGLDSLTLRSKIERKTPQTIKKIPIVCSLAGQSAQKSESRESRF
ncbi:hypothetical protein [uncultured Helicobacter sp.]|uniref:hypothetical protein n=1 Tax=uncultured Helicobacter sp. TaxID=175537 RepID=UPI00374F82CE